MGSQVPIVEDTGLKKIRIGQLGDRSKLAPAVESRAK
jgi:hypothetical protein